MPESSREHLRGPERVPRVWTNRHRGRAGTRGTLGSLLPRRTTFPVWKAETVSLSLLQLCPHRLFSGGGGQALLEIVSRGPRSWVAISQGSQHPKTRSRGWGRNQVP